MRVLIVDDHTIVRTGLRSLIGSMAGMELVGEATFGEQAVQLARTLRPEVIIASYQTSGMDVQSAMVACQALQQARNEEAGVLLISEGLEEFFALSDRLLVLYGGQIVGAFKPEETDVYTYRGYILKLRDLVGHPDRSGLGVGHVFLG